MLSVKKIFQRMRSATWLGTLLLASLSIGLVPWAESRAQVAQPTELTPNLPSPALETQPKPKPEAKPRPKRSNSAGSGTAAPARKEQARREPAARSEQSRLAEAANTNTVSVISGNAASTYFRIAGDLALVLDKEDELRVLPIQGRGGAQNAYDILLLRGVDVGIVKVDALDMLKADTRIRDPEDQLAYIARLFNDEMHVIAGKQYTDLRQLEGKKVNFDVKLSGSDYTGRRVFELLGVKVEASNLDQNSAMQALRKGEIDAAVSVAPKPVRFIADLKPEDNFHLLDVPYADALGSMYPPAEVNSADYPNLVDAAKPIKTVAVGSILATYNWPKNNERYRRVARFVEAFFGNIDRFDNSARHPKWKEVNIAADLPGWKRFPAATEWLAKSRNAQTNSQERFSDFEEFLKQKEKNVDSNISLEARQRLFEEFLSWQQSQR
jgi:uncharacterized protein